MKLEFLLDSKEKMSSIFKRLSSIQNSSPELTPENWCDSQPCVTIKCASKKIILTQPTSTIFVYALGLLTTGVGFYFLQIKADEISRLWWGIAMLLWGIGALLAGTSYQAFGYHIKCAGRERCSWTSWWEVSYLIIQQVSMDALLVAVAYSCTEGILQKTLCWFALGCAIIYTILTLIGGIIPVKTLITFERMVAISTPIFLISVALNSWRFYKFNETMDLVLLGCWGLLLITMLAYWLYDHFGITEKLWSGGKGIWFSQNDVLHIGLILWMIYIAAGAAHHIHDFVATI